MPVYTAAAALYACPDCNSDTRLAQLAPGTYTLQVLHDDTCPTLKEIHRDRRP